MYLLGDSKYSQVDSDCDSAGLDSREGFSSAHEHILRLGGGTTEMRVERSDAEGRREAPSSWVQENCPWIATSGSPQRQTSDLALMAPKVELQRLEKCPSLNICPAALRVAQEAWPGEEW